MIKRGSAYVQVDPCSHGQPFGGHYRRGIQQQVMVTDPMDTLANLPFTHGAGEQMMGPLDSAVEAQRL